VNRTQISQSTNKTGVEYFIKLLEKAPKIKKQKQNKQQN
jgi:hypothetical protein